MKHARRSPTPDTPTRLISTREVMARTTLSRSSLWRLSREGKLPAPVQVSANRIAWREREIEAFLNQRREVQP